MLEVRGLTVRYGSFVALDHVELTVADGEIVCVLGPSGSGKSTLLRAVAGLAVEVDGQVAWDGDDLTGVAPHRRGFGLMFQDHALFPHRDVIGNVSFGLRMQRLARSDVDDRARAALARVGLAGFEHRRVSELSGGEQQRVALARAIAPEPRLLMLDEPLGALDRALRDRLVGELRTLFTGLELSVVLVTHDHDEAFALADRVVVMQHGCVVQEGTPAALWQHPADPFVARFLGGNVTRALGGGLLAIRPEHLTLTSGLGVGAVVTSRTFRRDHYLVTVRLDDGALGGGGLGDDESDHDDELRVAVPVDGPVPDIGAPVRVARQCGGVVLDERDDAAE